MTSSRQWAVLLVVTLTAFITMLDNTVVTAAAPSIARDLDASLPTLEWVATGYMLAFAGLMLPGGRLADVYGHRRVLRHGLVGFAAASLVAALAGNAGVLIAARVAQGASAALVVPATLAIVGSATERDRLRGAAAWTASGATALALGPVVGGLLGEHAGWSWIFLLNVPVCAVAIACCAAIPDSRGVPIRIDLRDFAVPAFTGGISIQVLWGLGVNGVYFYTAIYLQNVRGLTPTHAGLAFLPLAAAVALGAPVTPWLTVRFGAARTVAAGLVLVALGMAAVALGGSSLAAVLVAFVVIGFGSALTVPLAACVLGAVPVHRTGVAGGVFGVAREASGAFGIAGIGAVIAVVGDFSRGYTVGLVVAAVLVGFAAVLSARTLPAAVDLDAERGLSRSPR